MKPKQYKVIVTGGRDYTNWRAIYRVLDMINPTCVVHGGASGADYYGGKWAKKHGKECKTYEAAWKILGPAAGPMRNQEMLVMEKPDAVVAFPGGKGTADMVSRAERAGVMVIKIEEEEVLA